MPPIYRCVSLTHENEHYKRRIETLKQEIIDYEKILQEQQHSSISCQTDLPMLTRPLIMKNDKENVRLHQLLAEQTELLSIYQEKAQHRQRESSTAPSLLIDNYEKHLDRCQKEKQQMENRFRRAEQRLKELEPHFQSLQNRLKLLDRDFFDELKDLKFAVQQAINLNREYERTIQLLSAQLGIEYSIDQ